MERCVTLNAHQTPEKTNIKAAGPSADVTLYLKWASLMKNLFSPPAFLFFLTTKAVGLYLPHNKHKPEFLCHYCKSCKPCVKLSSSPKHFLMCIIRGGFNTWHLSGSFAVFIVSDFAACRVGKNNSRGMKRHLCEGLSGINLTGEKKWCRAFCGFNWLTSEVNPFSCCEGVKLINASAEITKKQHQNKNFLTTFPHSVI